MLGLVVLLWSAAAGTLVVRQELMRCARIGIQATEKRSLAGTEPRPPFIVQDDSAEQSVGSILIVLRRELMRSTELMTSRRRPWVMFAAIAGFAAGAIVQNLPYPALPAARADGHGKADSSMKAPIAEVLHCPLAFEGTHLLKELPEVAQVAYHYCKPMNDDLVAQCLLYDGTGTDARLIGVEYLVSGDVYKKMPADEQAYWHDHKYEVDAGLLKSLTQTGAEEKATLAKVRTLYGKIFHTWLTGKTYPRGPARLFWSVTGEEPFVLAPNGGPRSRPAER